MELLYARSTGSESPKAPTPKAATWVSGFDVHVGTVGFVGFRECGSAWKATFPFSYAQLSLGRCFVRNLWFDRTIRHPKLQHRLHYS